MNKLLFAIAALFPFAIAHADESKAETPEAKLEFRLADDADSGGWQQMKTRDRDEPIYVSPDVVIHGGHIEKVSFYQDPNGNPTVGITLTNEGAEAMERATSQNLHKKLAVILNDQVISAPTIQSSITKEGQITGSFDKADLLAFFHAIVLRENR